MASLDADSHFIKNKVCLTVTKNGSDLVRIHFGEMITTNYYFILPIYLMQASLFFFISQMIYFLLRPLKQQKITCSILAGILIGPSILGRERSILDTLFPHFDLVVVNTVATLGGVYFMFIETVKLDTDRILRMAKDAWKVSLTCILLTFIVTFSLTRLLHKYVPGVDNEFFLVSLSIILSLSYFPVVARAISELKLLTTDLGQLAISCSLLNEMATWAFVALSMLSIRATKHIMLSELCLFVIILFTILVIRPIILWIIRSTPEGTPVHEGYIVGLLILPLLMGTLTDMIGMTVLPGAILVGLAIPPGDPLASALLEKCEMVTTNVLLPFFYMNVGQLTNIYSIKDWRTFAAILLIFVEAVLTKMFASFLATLYFKTTTRNAILLSFFLNLRGINEYLLAIQWRTTEIVDEATYTAVVFGNMLLTAILTPLIDIYYKPPMTTHASVEHKPSLLALQAMPLNIELRILCCIHYEENVHGIITLLKALNPVEISPVCAYLVHLQELVGRATPLLAPYNNTKRRKLFSNSTDRIMRAVTNNLKSSCLPITLQPYTMIAPYSTMHQSICRLAREKAIPLILIPFHKSREVHERALSLRNLNMNMQEHSPSTVGIFVDRGMPRQLNSTRLAYHVAVFFLGGPDDREAMALVSRMSEHFAVSITLLRIILRADYDKEENKNEKSLDDSVINEFLSKNSDNPCVVCYEVVANETMEVIDTIRFAEKDYDLVIVGKRRLNGSSLELSMELWVEHKELGVIGDMIASKDFCGGNLFVLVIQYCVGTMSFTDERSRPSFCSLKSVP